MKDRTLPFYIGLAGFGIVLDQFIKYLVETHLALREMVEVLPFLALYRTYNTGIAFSFLSSTDDTTLIVIALAVIGFVIWLAVRSDPSHVLARTGFALIVSGAIGNLIDRSVQGHVIDYILFHTPVWSFAVFNLADVFISLGAAAVLAQELFGGRSRKSADAGEGGARPE